MWGTTEILARFPKKRIPLPAEYQEIYEEHYKNNRDAATPATFFSSKLESWMHKKVAADMVGHSDRVTLEIGAGNLNQLKYESPKVYDIIEPFSSLFETSAFRERVRNIYEDICEIPGEQIYDRIISVAAFEHICDLPDVVASCKRLLKHTPNASLRVAIPNEGRFLWKFGYTMTTGIEFRRKYKLDYSLLMNYEHVNTADEIEKVLQEFFPNVRQYLLGISRTFAFYRYFECRA